MRPLALVIAALLALPLLPLHAQETPPPPANPLLLLPEERDPGGGSAIAPEVETTPLPDTAPEGPALLPGGAASGELSRGTGGAGALLRPGLGQETDVIEEAGISAQGARLRALDRLANRLEDIELEVGKTAAFGRLEIRLLDCRVPRADPGRDAAAAVEIIDRRDGPAFAGWMLASSPALNPMDHQRYDVWVLGCTGIDADALQGGGGPGPDNAGEGQEDGTTTEDR